MSTDWQQQKERSTKSLLKFAAWSALRFRRAFVRFFFYPIILYFLVFSAKARRSSRKFLDRTLGNSVNLSHIFKHYFYFGATIHDRALISANRLDQFSIKIEGLDIVTKLLSAKQGCILLGSHLGCFDILRAIGKQSPYAVHAKMLMDTERSKMMNDIYAKLDPKFKESIIEVGNVNTLLQVSDCIAQGQLVGILGDRAVDSERSSLCTFLGQQARFPLSPYYIASITKAPIVLFFGLYEGKNRYRIFFEEFSSLKDLERLERSEYVHNCVKQYVRRLEHYAKLAPYNWFNFYDYWQ